MAKTRWENDLGDGVSEGKWYRIKNFSWSFSQNVGIQESRFKLLSRWYLTLDKLAKMYPQMKGECWRCHGRGADFLHVWWSCDKVVKFWKEINSKVQEMMMVQAPLNSRAVLLLGFEDSKLKKCKDFIAHLLTSATLLIAKRWDMTDVSAIKEWFSKIRYMCLLNKLSAMCTYGVGNVNVLKVFCSEGCTF